MLQYEHHGCLERDFLELAFSLVRRCTTEVTVVQVRSDMPYFMNRNTVSFDYDTVARTFSSRGSVPDSLWLRFELGRSLGSGFKSRRKPVLPRVHECETLGKQCLICRHAELCGYFRSNHRSLV